MPKVPNGDAVHDCKYASGTERFYIFHPALGTRNRFSETSGLE